MKTNRRNFLMGVAGAIVVPKTLSCGQQKEKQYDESVELSTSDGLLCVIENNEGRRGYFHNNSLLMFKRDGNCDIKPPVGTIHRYIEMIGNDYEIWHKYTDGLYRWVISTAPSPCQKLVSLTFIGFLSEVQLWNTVDDYRLHLCCEPETTERVYLPPHEIWANLHKPKGKRDKYESNMYEPIEHPLPSMADRAELEGEWWV